MKKVLLTGASGFIGRHCLTLLQAKAYEVHAVSRKPVIPLINEIGSNVYWHQADLLNPQNTEDLLAEVRPTHLLHLAWYAVPREYWTSTENLRWVQGSLALFRSFMKYGGERAVVAGTCAEYDWGSDCCSETTTALAPRTLYGNCKHALQLILSAFAAQQGLSLAWGRIFFLYGPNEDPARLVASVIQSLLKDQTARCTSGQQERDFLYVEDVADAFVALLASQTTGPINIASGVRVMLREVVQEIGRQMSRPDLIQFGALPDSANDPACLVADITRLREELEWQPNYDLKTGLARTIEWWKKEFEMASQP
ncbi:MAG: NAD(P)-dependent oxidoreductase [Acidobacteriota bacterium]|nr:NAD(P)-dependent oxidoreductase [Acidobacteriota bacterium]